MTGDLQLSNKALIQAHYVAMINWFDPDAVRAQIADDFFDHQSGCALSADDVIAYAQELHTSFTDLFVTLDDMVAEGDRVAVRATWRGVQCRRFRGHAPTDGRISFTGMVFWRVRGGKIAERWAEIDFGALAARAAEKAAA